MRRPPLVDRALARAADDGSGSHCRDPDGALLHVLAGRRGVGRPGEIGAGVGVGSAWIVSALPPGTPFVTVERDVRLAAVATDLFADDPEVTVHAGDWRALLSADAPFDFLFVDADDARDDPDTVVGLLQPRATVVLDDFTVGPSEPNARHEAWLGHPALTATLVATDGAHAALIAVRR